MLSFKDYTMLTELFDTSNISPWFELMSGDMYICDFDVPNSVPYSIQLINEGSIESLLTSSEVNQLPDNVASSVRSSDHVFVLTFAPSNNTTFDIIGSGNAAFILSSVINNVHNLLSGNANVYKKVKNFDIIFPNTITSSNIKELIANNAVKLTTLPTINTVILSAKEPSRIKLYDRMAPKFASSFNMNYGSVVTDRDKYYIFTTK